MSKRKIKKDMTNTEATVTFKSFFGDDVTYNIVLLKRKKAAMVFHNSVQALLGSFGNIDKMEGASFMKAVDGLDFEKCWSLGGTLLDQCMVNGEEIDFEDYFGERPVELYQAMGHALLLNYPDVFTRARAVMTKMKERFKKFVASYRPGEKSVEAIVDALDKAKEAFSTDSTTEPATAEGDTQETA